MRRPHDTAPTSSASVCVTVAPRVPQAVSQVAETPAHGWYVCGRVSGVEDMRAVGSARLLRRRSLGCVTLMYSVHIHAMACKYASWALSIQR